MAEFKLGRIRFVWQGEWTTARSYVPDDVVAVGGQTYICVASHTASSLFQTDLTNIPTRWNLVAGGTKWEGDWSVSTYYNAGDQVKYGGTVYVCLVPHTSAATLELGLEEDQSKWQAFAQSPFWTGNWSAETRYRVNDFVVYGGTTYICNEAHTSADTVDGLELDQDKWDIFNQGIVYLGEWAEATRYKLNDIVKYGASTWICVTPHTSDTEFSTDDFALFVEGLQFESTWDTDTVYQNGDVVTYGGYSYISKTVHSGSLPTTSPDDWELYTTGFNFRGDWLDSTAYKVGDVVRSGAYTYVAILDSTNQAPPGATFWRQLNSGFKWKTSSATYTGVSGTNLIGSGTSATFDVSRVGTTYAVEVNAAGSGYAINNTIKVLGTDLGGSSPANDLVITVTGVDEGEITTVGSVGYGSTWVDAVDYQEGDVVFWGASSFVCVDSHTSSTLNRPDTDLTGTIWSLLAAGSESLVLTTEGDTYFYSENGPARLPIGQDGQILRVKQGFPAWEYYGIINNLVYVGPTGVDSIDEGWGLSIDKPWASVRFALEQIEKGYHNRQAAALLRKNKQFVMKEVSNWVTYTYTVDITASSSVTNAFTCNSTANLSANMPIEFSGTVGGVTAGTKYYVRTVLDNTSFTISNTQGGILRTLTTQTANMTGTLSYDSALCERDVGLLIDALSYDIGHGGNEEVTKAARAYYTKAGGRYINSNFAEQITQTVSSYQYMVELIDDVLKNDEPDTSYQIENGVAEANRVWQIIDTSLEAEDQALDLVPDLMNVVVNGLLAGSELAIPASINSNTTVSVKTGTYFEVLPMIIPKNTAVVGDELRSTVIRPQPAIANLANDREKTISALNRINDIIPDLVQNNSVTPTAGNTLSAVQVQGTLDGDNEFIEGSVGTYSAVERVETAANAIYDILSDGMAAAPVEVMPNPVGFDTGFLNARTQITNNYAFIKADVSRFIQNNYASVWTALGVEGQAKCQRDIEYILDAIRYDLTYGGNTQTLIAGRSYYTYINLVIPEATEAATLAAYTHMRSIIDDVARALTVTPQAGNSTPQSVSGSGGSTDAATFAQARMQDIIDWIDNGTSPAEIQPSLSWVSADLQAGFAEIQSRKAEIQQDGLAYVNKFFQELTFNEATCSRDIAYMVDAIAYDTAFGSNFASVIAGKSYYRNLDSTALVLANQKKASLGLIKFLKYKLRGLAVGGGAAKAAVAIHSIVGTINGGKQPRYQWPSYSTIDTSDYAAAKLISQNKKFIAAEVQKFIDDNYPEIYYSETACMRDVEYILDAVRYDLTYGGSFASKQAGVAYYSRLTTALQIDADDKTATLAAYATLKSVVQSIANGGTYTPLQTNVTRITGATGNADSATLAGSLIDVITDIIDDGLVDGVRTITITGISGGNTLVTGTAHNLAIGDEIVARSTANGIDEGVTYYVKTTPSSTEFTVSSTWNGTELSTFVDAGGATIFTSERGYNASGTYGDMGTSFSSDTPDVWSASSFGWFDVNNYNTLIAFTSGTPFTMNFRGTTFTGTLTSDFIDQGFNRTATVSWTGSAPTVSYYDSPNSFTIGGITYSNRSPYQTSFDYLSGAVSASDSELVVAGPDAWSDPAEFNSTIALTTGAEISVVYQGNTYTGTLSSNFAELDPEFDPGRYTASITWQSSSGLETFPLSVESIDISGSGGGGGPELSIVSEVTDLPGISWVSADMITQATTLQSAKATLINLTSGFIDENYPNLDYDANTCRRDMGYVIDALTYDMLMNSNFRSIKAGLAYYQAQASKVVADQKRATLQTFRELRRLVSNTVSSSAEARLAVRAGMDLIIDILEFGPGEEVDVHGTLTYANDTGMLNASSILAANVHFLAEEASAWISQNYGGTVTDTISPDNTFTTSAPHNLAVNDVVRFSESVFGGIATDTQYFVTSVPTALTFTVSLTKGGTNISLSTTSGTMTVRYDFDPEACKRDMREYVEAVVYDMRWPGNYKSTSAAVLYANAVKGSEYSDMFRTRNACGLRNCTLLGLNGELSGENEFGTKRPTAGAYVALDPGFGPNDQNVWITTRSHYSQNVTMFGTGCTGAKIDSSLHTGGNKSMVKNDFTTIMSDGIGVWCTGSDSLTELVSVFNYYGYAGYIADKGGRIRATNGNSSYGTYGVIAEGVSSKETPLYARVDNKYAQAQITNTVTDGTTEVLRFEFGNAGSNYSNTVHTISASGFNARAVADEYRDNAVFETRIIDPDDGQDFGGSNYVTASNAAQGGSLTEITIAATDTALTNAYNGMRIQITAGTGVGQYANILSFLNGTKVAKVYKDSFTPITVTSTTDTGDFVNVASNATLYVDMPVYFTGTTFGGIQANQLYYVRALTGTTQFTISETEGGSAVNVTTGTGSMTLLAAGWDHAVPGKTIANALDLTTAYIIEPRVEYSAPGYTTSSVSLASATWRDIVWADNRFVAIANNSTATTQSPTGVTWQTAGALPSSSNWTSLVYGGGSGSSATAIVGGLNGRGAQFRAILGEPNTTGAATADQIASVEVIDGGQGYDTPPVIVFTPVNGGTGATAVCAVLDGKVTAVTVTIPGSGYLVAPTVTAATDRVTRVAVNAWGRNYYTNPTVTISDPYVGTQWATNTSVTLNSIIFHTNTTVTPNLKNWYRVTTAGTTGVGGPVHASGTVNNGTASLLYIGTTAVLTPSRVSATGTVDGVVSIAVTNTGRGYTETPTVTITDPDAKYVAIANGSTDTAYTTSATVQSLGAWTAGGALPASTFTSLAYGNGIYVAVGGTNSAVSSVNGTTFTNRVIPTLGAGTYSSVAYGNERFVAISTGNNQTAYSENGTSWVVGGTLPASTTWTSIAYGNGRFVAVASGGRNVAYSIDRGVTWVAAPAGLPVSASWTKVVYGQGLFLAIASGTTVCATSPDGVNWTQRAQPSSSSWISGAFGNPGARGTFVSVSAVSPTSIAARTLTGARALGRIRTASGIVAEARMIEPGSGYPSGTVTATAASTDLITVDNTVNLVNSMPVEFYGTSAGGLEEQFTYYVIGSTITSTGFKVSFTQGSTTPVQLDDASISGMTYRAAPVFDVIDPNKVRSAAFRARMGDGALGNPSFPNRGSDNATAQAETLGDGHANLYQPSTFIAVNGLYDVPTPGANVEFASLPGQYFKLVTVTNVLGELGNYTAVFQLNPGITVLQAPNHGDLVTTRIKYSQVRLTGHDFLYIGTGNFNQTNYPNVDISTASQDNQAQFSAGGRVFFTSTDQDGNFNVGNLFGVQQATGTATLNASAFNLSGLNSLQLGSVELGIGSAIITQFSTDPFFTADSDNVVPTQRAIKSYITAQIGGGQSSLNVNTLTSGVVYIAGNSISTTTGVALNVTSKMNFTGGIDGAPVALGFFMQR